MDRDLSWPVLSAPTTNHFNLQSPISCQPSKRQREQEDIPFYNEELIRETKKHRPLPLRSPPKHSQRSSLVGQHLHSSLSALTPVESSDDETIFTTSFSGPTAMGARRLLQPSHTPELDSDMSMDIDTVISGSDTDQRYFSPAIRNTTYDSSKARRLLPDFLQSTQSIPLAIHSGAAPEIRREIPWCNSRLPSPVSDNGDPMVRKETSGDTEMTFNASPLEHYPSLNSTAVEVEAADMRKRLSSLDLPNQRNTEQSPNTSPFKKLGFSMGYRADCDKCRRRVPGHYSHINR
ncbi:hypothetical protein BJY04DRAFT_188863 [Aspergillus karnatakaensis]|uniref:uncharacterized protein n=1 Tax=Aspergillus karnatakaensis TaxID=1810916 RepID=UPI003CCD0A5F